MLFSSLAEKLQDTFQKLKRKGKLSEKDVDAALREVRMALLEADVNYKVAKDFTAAVKERAIGAEVTKSLTPGQQVIKVVHAELVRLMGETQSKLAPPSPPPQVVMMVGLQGSGKTTSAAKLAVNLRRDGHRPLLVAADIYRPAAIHQLEVLGRETEIPVFSMGKEDPLQIGRAALKKAELEQNDYLILDTAGRLHIDDALMSELIRLKEGLTPLEILLVVDAMTGQDAVNVAGTFHQQLGLTGAILTKLDGDTRGGAALSVRAVTGCPIKFSGTGEKIDAFEPFHPDRMASRILGMGDVLSLIDKAQQVVDVEKSRELEQKMLNQSLTLEDFLEQLQQVRQMGPLDELMGMIPGMNKAAKGMKNMAVDEKELVKAEAIVRSMTRQERLHPDVINSSRRRRISLGSGTTVQDVNRLLKQFGEMKKMLKQFSSMDKSKLKKTKGLFPFK